MILKRAGLDPGPRDAPGRPGDRPLDATGSAACCTRTCTSHAVTGFSAPTRYDRPKDEDYRGVGGGQRADREARTPATAANAALVRACRCQALRKRIHRFVTQDGSGGSTIEPPGRSASEVDAGRRS